MSQALQGAGASARRIAGFAAALVVFAAPVASAQFSNPGFENGLTGWVLDGYKTSTPFASGISTTVSHSGAQSVALTRSDPATYGAGYGTYLYQWVPSTTSTIFTLNYWVSGVADANSFFSAWTSDGNTSWNTVASTAGSINGWTNYSATFNGEAGQTAIGFQSENGVGAYYLDDVTLTSSVVVATPEPASMVLLGTGLLGVFGFARRRRQA